MPDSAIGYIKMACLAILRGALPSLTQGGHLMAHRNRARTQRQVAAHHRRLAQAPALPFSDSLDQQRVQQALDAERVSFRHRIFSPLVTVWTFLSQCLDPDHCCRQAVARVLAWRTSQGLPPCSTNTGSYCAARARLPEGVLARLTRDTARRLQG